MAFAQSQNPVLTPSKIAQPHKDHTENKKKEPSNGQNITGDVPTKAHININTKEDQKNTSRTNDKNSDDPNNKYIVTSIKVIIK